MEEVKTKSKVPTITKEQLSEKIRSNTTLQIVNVLSPDKYALGFIKGSRKIPLSELDKRLNELDKTKEIVTYCASDECNASTQAAEKLISQGFKVSAYEGGVKEWKTAGLPMD